jgi:hypothetical protein
MGRLRSRLTYANVVATISLFIVLGGTATAASYVVRSNKQVAPNTISGHQPPKKKHANLIAGSINAADLAAGAVTRGKLGTSAVTGGNVDTTSVSSALGLRHAITVVQAGATDQTLFHSTIWTLTAACLSTGPGTYQARVDLGATEPAFVAVGSSGGEGNGDRVTSAIIASSSFSASTTSVSGTTFVAQMAPISGTVTANSLQGSVIAAFDTEPGDFSSPACVFEFDGTGS